MKLTCMRWQLLDIQVRLAFQCSCQVPSPAYGLCRFAKEMQTRSGALGALCPWGGNLGRLGSSERQPYCGPLVGAGETQLPSRRKHQDQSLTGEQLHHLNPGKAASEPELTLALVQVLRCSG